MVADAEEMNLVPHKKWQTVLEEEENQWRKGHLQFSSSDHGLNSVPTVLEQCPSVSNLHGYFSNLESRKCCLKLASVNTTFSTIRLITEDSTSDSSFSLVNSLTAKSDGRLSEKDFWVYRRALFAANFPVLSVPDPPTEPTPVFLEPSHEATSIETSQQTHGSQQDSIKFKLPSPLGFGVRSSSNSYTSGIDSMDSAADGKGNRSADDMAVLTTEILTDWLRKVYGLSVEANRVYEKRIYEPYRKRTYAKILVEELCRQLSLLENDSHPFYNSRMFLSREAYSRWRQRERSRISHMMSKFWHQSLPPVRHSNNLDVAQYHEDYRSYLHKVIAYENQVRKTNGSGDVGFLISSVSRRLLKEYTLRYGIRDLYEDIVYLDLLGENFNSSPGFVRRVIEDMTRLRAVLPKTMAKSVLVLTEYEILWRTLDCLQGHCKNILTRIKRVYQPSEIVTGVGNVIQLLALVVELKEQLDVDNSPTLQQLLQLYTKENLYSSYERHKIIAMNDLQIDPRTSEVTPKLINRLTINIKDEVLDYQRSYAEPYQRYLDVVKFAANVLYDLLMEDVTNFCVTTNNSQLYPGIDLPVLGLVYRLDQLDRDGLWSDMVPCTRHVWRREFYSEILHWVKMLEKHGERFILQSVGSDQFEWLSIEGSGVDELIQQESRCTSTNSQTSLTPSQHSAFSAVTSYRSLQIPIFPLQPYEKEEELNADESDPETVEQSKEEHSSTSPDILRFQVNDPLGTVHDRKPSPPGGQPLRCQSEPKLFVRFSDKVERFDVSRSWNEGGLMETGYFSESGSDFIPSPRKKPSVGLESINETIAQTSGENALNGSLRSKDISDDVGGLFDRESIKRVSDNIDSEDVNSLAGEIDDVYLMQSTPLRPDRESFGCSANSAFGVADLELPTPLRDNSTVNAPRFPKVTSLPNMKTKFKLTPRPRTSLQNGNHGDHRHHNEANDDDGNTDEILDAPLLVSSSVVELVLLVKRVVHSVKTLCDTVYPLKQTCSVDDMEEELSSHLKHSVIMRWKLTQILLENVSSMVKLYSYNMLCVDLCGETNCVANTGVGAQHVEKVKSLYRQKLLWGCRHKINRQPCHMYPKKKKVPTATLR